MCFFFFLANCNDYQYQFCISQRLRFVYICFEVKVAISNNLKIEKYSVMGYFLFILKDLRYSSKPYREGYLQFKYLHFYGSVCTNILERYTHLFTYIYVNKQIDSKKEKSEYIRRQINKEMQTMINLRT